MKKILVLDLDGTLTNDEKKITPKTKQALEAMLRQGHKVVLASGRPTVGVLPVANELQLNQYESYILSYNGGSVLNCKTNEVIYNQTLPDDIVPQLFALADQIDMGMMTYNTAGIVANMHHDEFMELEAKINHLKLHHFEKPLEQLNNTVNKCLGTVAVSRAPQVEQQFMGHFGDRISVSRSEPFFIELVPKGIDKAASLAKLCELLHCTKDDMIACGDGFNDLSMIRYAGLGVAMENAQDTVKEAADYITLSNNHDGIAHVIEKFILNEQL
mgnify:CR=1 FL=1